VLLAQRPEVLSCVRPRSAFRQEDKDETSFFRCKKLSDGHVIKRVASR
jgi:hypothetical protein